MQTLTIQEAETRLHALVKQAQTSQQPVLLTDEIATPMAVLIDPVQYGTWATTNEPLLSSRLQQLQDLLATLAAQWQVEPVRQAFPSAWRWRLEGVWESSRHREDPFRQLVVLLQMAARSLQMVDFAREHLALFQQCVDILRQPVVTMADLAQCDEALITQGFPVLLEFDDEMIATYGDER